MGDDNATPEEWRPVDGWPYEVSSLGRVRRTGPDTLGRSSGRKTSLLRQQRIWTGYLRVRLCHGDRLANRYVHGLVAHAFIGPKPVGMEVNHRNGSKADNRAWNLEYVTRAENMRHAHRHGLVVPRSGDDHPWRQRPELIRFGSATANAKLDEAKVTEIRRRYAAGGVTHARLAAEYGVSPSLMTYVINRKTWRHVP